MANISDSLIEEIIQLCDGSFKDQKKACKLIREKIFGKNACIDGSTLPKLLPSIVKLITSKDRSVIQDGADFVEVITNMSDSVRNDEQNTHLVIDHNATVNLVKCLSSPVNEEVILQCLKCLANITLYFPAEAIKHNALPSIVKCLKLKNDDISYHAVKIFNYVAIECEETFSIIRGLDGVVALKNLLESSSENPQLFEVSLTALGNIIYHHGEACQYVLELDGLLNLMETIFERFFNGRKKLWKNLANTSEIQKEIKVSAIRFILNATYYNEKQIDMVLAKNFVKFIVKQIGGIASNEIKNKSLFVVDNIIQKKPSYIPNLMNDGIISSLYKNLDTRNFELLKNVLTILYNFILYSGYDETVRQKIVECGNPEKLQNLLQRQDLKKLPEDIYNFVENVDANESSDLNDEEPGPVVDIDISDTNNNVGSQEIVTTETSAFGVQKSTTDIQNRTRGNKRLLNASEQAEPFYKRSRKVQSTQPKSILCNSKRDQRSSFPQVTFNLEESSSDSENAVTFKLHESSNDCESAVAFDLHESNSEYENAVAFLSLNFFCFERITPDSKPKRIFSTNDKSGFGAFSLLFAGTESFAEKIRIKVVEKYIDYMDSLESSSKEKLKQIVTSTSLTVEHLETIARWFNFRIMVYCDGKGWEKYGVWNSENEHVPVFVLKKIQSGNGFDFEMILSVE